jgi:hypothetical protein
MIAALFGVVMGCFGQTAVCAAEWCKQQQQQQQHQHQQQLLRAPSTLLFGVMCFS